MIEAYCVDLETNKKFSKVFWNVKEYNKFVNKCKYSKKIKIINIIDNSKFYD